MSRIEVEARKKKRQLSIGEMLLHLALVLCSIVCLVPVLLVAIVSLTDEKIIVKNGYSFFPKKLSLAAFEFVLERKNILFNAYGVTIFVTLIGTIISVLVITLFAYPISRKNFRFKNFFTFFIFFTMLFDGGLVPWYLMCTQVLHLKNTIWALIIPYLFNAWYVLIVRTFYQSTIPDSLVESAKIDGASEIRIFRSIVIPLSKPVLATIGLFTTLSYWNDWWLALMLIGKENLYNLQYTIYQVLSNLAFLTNSTLNGNSNVVLDISNLPNETARMAMALFAIGPILLVYPFMQRYFVKGLTIGAVKG